MIMQTKLIAEQRHLTWGLRRHLHAHHPGLPLYSARPIDDILRKHSPGFELLNESFHSTVCFSPANIPDGLTYYLKNFKPRDGYHATGLQFITDNLDLVVLRSNTLGRQRPGGGAERKIHLFESPRTAYVYLSDPTIRLNSAPRIELVFTPHLFRPAAEHFLDRLSETRAVPSFNIKYREIRSRFAELLWVDYAMFLRDNVSYVSTYTDQCIYEILRHEVSTARQRIAEYNVLLGLDEDNSELFPFGPDFSFRVQRFFSQINPWRSARTAHP
jgi:hypothetical protein